MLTPEEVVEGLTLGHETRGFEIKGAGSRDDGHLFAKVTRAALSMGNLRDGGYVLIGLDDKAPEKMLPGLSDDDLEGWLDFDTVSARLANYADPPLRFEIAQITLPTDAHTVLIEVREFSDSPHLCARNYPGVLREGALYVRTHRLPETAEVPTSNEMREVLDLATEKRLRAFVATADRSGVKLSVAPDESELVKQSAEKFETQLEEAWGGE